MKLDLDLTHLGTRIDDLIFVEEKVKPKAQMQAEGRTAILSIPYDPTRKPSSLLTRMMARGKFDNGVRFVVAQYQSGYLLGAILPDGVPWKTTNTYTAAEIETFLHQLEEYQGD